MPNPKNLLANFFILSGLGLILTVTALTQYDKVLGFLNPQKIIISSNQQSDITPTKIQISGIIDLPVVPGEYKKGEWDLVSDKALYLKSSGIPGKKGNSVFYGHDTDAVFGKLEPNLKIGDRVTVSLSNSQKITYKIDSLKRVYPNDISILKQTDSEVLTIFTCTGLFDSLRFVVTASPV